VDIPSGVDGATGSVRGAAVWAEVTVTFGAHKPGVVFFPGAAHAGFVEVAAIGFPADLVASDLQLLEAADVAGLLPLRDADAHKRASGVVLVLAGSQAMTGAAVLTATAAYRAGAGLVIMAVVEESVAETTFLALPETSDGTVAETAWPLLEERLATVDAAAVGPGLTTNDSTGELVRRVMAHSPAPIVLDADGLNAFEGRGVELADRKSDAVLTPHLGEFARLVGGTSQEIADQRVAQIRAASSEFRCPVLLKGTRTLVGEPGGRVTVNPTGGRYLATGGTGDVLTGAIAAFLARGLAPADAARLAAFVHGAAGQLAGADLGEGAMASDVLARLPEAMTALARAGP
jgi:NAD(P)H-hydrate epimerase